MQYLKDKKILLGITGSIAAYKACELVRLLVKQGACVEVIMTESALHFVGKTTFEALTGNKVHTSMWSEDGEAPIAHISLIEKADLFIIAPASANIIAKMAAGICDDLLSTVAAARRKPMILAPAMNMHMWQNPSNQCNIDFLTQYGNVILSGPAEGSQACGDVGKGRFKEPAEILEDVIRYFAAKTLDGKKLLITVGPTFEPIDPVRGITNSSSGKQGIEIANAAVRAGAAVTVVCGPIRQSVPQGAKRINVTTALQMHEAVMNECAQNRPDLFISVAAVADYRPAYCSEQKIKKGSADESSLQLVKNPDILADVARLPNPPMCIGFAAETENLIEYAQAKLRSKRVPLIVANNAAAIGQDSNQASFVSAGRVEELGVLSKEALAEKIIEKAAEML